METNEDNIQKVSDYKVGDIVGVIVPSYGKVNTIVGKVIIIESDSITIRPRDTQMYRKDIKVSQEVLDKEEVVLSKYN